jgi:hypothetical protein
MSMPVMLLLLVLLFEVKHLLADFYLQSAAMVRLKGTYGNPVGASHSLVHAAMTPLILAVVTPLGGGVIAVLAVAEFLIHYHTDWLKDRLTKRGGYTPAQKTYWTLVGLDQFVHRLTYLLILVIIVATA